METDLTFILNDQVIRTKINPATILLDFIRKNRKLTSTKEVCKEGDCGACAVLLGELNNGSIKYKTINSCLFPIQKVQGKHIVTLEGLNSSEISLIQKSFIDEGASQCGFCTPGFLISLTGYLLNTSKFDEIEAINSVAGNICRCTGYHSIIRSIKNIGELGNDISIQYLIGKNVIPGYFEVIPKKLTLLEKEQAEDHKVYESDCQLVSGGTDLFVQKPDELLSKKVQFIENLIVPYINIVDDNLVISGSSTIDELQQFIDNNTNIKLKKLFNLFASQPIRNSATIAGNIINASPIADFTITLLALNSKITLESNENKTRIIELCKFYKGYKTLDKEENEFIKEISFKVPESNSLYNFEKVSKRTHLDIASVNSAILLKVENLQIVDSYISAGGVSPIPLLLRKSSEFMRGMQISDETIKKLLEIVSSEISPITDIRGSKEYKTLLLKQLIKSHFLTLFPTEVTKKVLYE